MSLTPTYPDPRSPLSPCPSEASHRSPGVWFAADSRPFQPSGFSAQSSGFPDYTSHPFSVVGRREMITDLYWVFLIKPRTVLHLFIHSLPVPCVFPPSASTCCSFVSGCLWARWSPPSLLLFHSPTPSLLFCCPLCRPRPLFSTRPGPAVNAFAFLSIPPVESVLGRRGKQAGLLYLLFISLCLSFEVSLPTWSSWALGITRSSSSSPSSSSRSSFRVSSSSSGLGAQKVKGRLHAHTSPSVSTYTNWYSTVLGRGR